MSELSIAESIKQDYEEEINKQAKVIQWYEKENRHNQEIILKDTKEIERLNNIINELEKWLKDEKEATVFDYHFAIEDVLDKLQELKGSDKE